MEEHRIGGSNLYTSVYKKEISYVSRVKHFSYIYNPYIGTYVVHVHTESLEVVLVPSKGSIT